MPSSKMSYMHLTSELHCRLIRHNVSNEELDEYTASYDIYRKSLTANRIALYANTVPELAMDWARGFSPKFAMHVDTAVRLLLQTNRYYFSSSLAKVGGNAVFDPVRTDMCAPYTQLHASLLVPHHCVTATMLAWSCTLTLSWHALEPRHAMYPSQNTLLLRAILLCKW